jgi:putative intracellular protease/amidase
VETRVETVMEEIRLTYVRGKAHAIIVVAEGAKYNAERLVHYAQEHRDQLGFDLRSTVLGHVQRGGAPGAFDRLLATRLGAAATERLSRGEHGVLLGLLASEITPTPLEEVVAMRTLLRYIAVVLASMLLPAAVGIAGGVSASRSQYAPLDDPGPVPAAATPQTHDPDRPTAVVILGANGGQVSDVLAPYEILVTAEAFNVYTAAPERRPLPLTGGLHLIPDLTFAELDARLGAGNAADVVIVPRLPDGGEPSTEPVKDWLRQQAAAGALMVSVCDGARVLASTGLLDGRVATSHWARLGGLERDYPDVRWVRGTRYVDDGDVITSAGLLSSIDGTLRVVERLAGPEAASRTADAVDWGSYSPGAPASIPVSRLGPDAVLRPLNAAYHRARLGVLLTEGVGEIELASVFDTYSGQSFAMIAGQSALHGAAIASEA